MTDKEYKIRTEIADLESKLEKSDDSGWCLGDPYEVLAELRCRLAIVSGRE